MLKNLFNNNDVERYHNAKTIEPNVLIVRFIRKSDRFKIDHVKFRATEDGDKEDYTFLTNMKLNIPKVDQTSF